jgi:triosephosphate isomerase
MLQSFSVEYVIVGHSERRALGETDEMVNKKIHALLKKKITPVVCVGEKNRDEQGNFFNVVTEQIKSLVKDLAPKDLTKVVIAYEPVWAIGTGKTATVEDVKEMQIFIVSTLTKLYDRKTAEKITLLYGGSVKASIAKELFEQGGMQGFLVGGASLQAEEFINIVKVTI